MADAKTEKQKVKEITDKLEEGLKELFGSEKYKLSVAFSLIPCERLHIALISFLNFSSTGILYSVLMGVVFCKNSSLLFCFQGERQSHHFESEKYKNYLSTMSKFHNYMVFSTIPAICSDE